MYKGRDIRRHYVPPSGLKFDRSYEWREVAYWARMPFEQFINLAQEAQEGYIAHYRTQRAIEAVMAKAQVDKNKAEGGKPARSVNRKR